MLLECMALRDKWLFQPGAKPQDMAHLQASHTEGKRALVCSSAALPVPFSRFIKRRKNCRCFWLQTESKARNRVQECACQREVMPNPFQWKPEEDLGLPFEAVDGVYQVTGGRAELGWEQLPTWYCCP